MLTKCYLVLISSEIRTENNDSDIISIIYANLTLCDGTPFGISSNISNMF